MNKPPQAPRLIINHPEAMTTHNVAESLIKLAMMLRRLPDLPCTSVEFWLDGRQPVVPEEQKSADREKQVRRPHEERTEQLP